MGENIKVYRAPTGRPLNRGSYDYCALLGGEIHAGDLAGLAKGMEDHVKFSGRGVTRVAGGINTRGKVANGVPLPKRACEELAIILCNLTKRTVVVD